MKELVGKHIKQLIPYEPGKPIEELERELGIKNSVKLASNESPLSPSSSVIQALKKGLKDLNRYPDGGGFYLKRALSKKWGLRMSNILLGNGSNEIIEMIAKTFLLPGQEAVMAHPAFIIYQLSVLGVDGKRIIVPLKDFTHDLIAMAERITDKTKLIFIANPNNPTGTMNTESEMGEFMRRVPSRVIVVVDEAYFEYVTRRDYPKTIDYLKKGKNIIILRSFSKIYGLAGLRVGYAMAKEGLINEINRVRQPFNTNSLAQLAAVTALKDKEHIRKNCRLNSEGKRYLCKQLTEMDIEYIPSETNFILINVGNGNKVYKKLLRKGVIVRPMGGYSLPEYIRVTIGLHGENRRFIKELKEII